MKTRLFPVLAMSTAMLTATQAVQTDEPAPTRVDLSLSLKDGSLLKATPAMSGLVVSQKIAGQLNLDWSNIKSVDLSNGPHGAVLGFSNGDRMTATIQTDCLKVDSLLGRVDVPFDSISKLGVTVIGGPCRNVALGKPVHGRDGASHGRGLAKHVTDGDPTTHAKPPGSSFDYRIDLQKGTQASFGINRIVINWGRFGDRFVGIRQEGGEQWASGSWPGEYVTSYIVEYRQVNDETWKVAHRFEGRPVDEKADNVVLIKQPAKDPGCSSESITSIDGLQLARVAELRVRAKGGHWIGLYELEAWGWRE